MNRSGKWYRKNEAEVMKSLGLVPTPNSGSGWLIKEDGQNESLICQLKSTEANSIKVNKLDLDKLAHNASVCHKIPVFAIQFIQSNEVYLIIKPDDLNDIANGISDTYSEANRKVLDDFDYEDIKLLKPNKQVISGGSKSRDRFHNEIKERFDKTKYAK